MSGYRKWPRYCRWRLADQDVIADIESIRRDFEIIKELDGEKYGRVIQLCEAALDDCASELKLFWWINRLFIRQTLSQVQQQLILIVPLATLDGLWLALKKRLDTISENEKIKYFLTDTAAIDRFFAPKADNNAQPENTVGDPDEPHVRGKMRAIRKYLDEKLLAELWAAYSLQRTTKFFVFLLLPIVAAIFFLLHVQHSGCLSEKIAGGWSIIHVVTTSVFGALGSLISAVVQPDPGKRVVQPDPGKREEEGLPLTRFSYMRPILGGVSGLFLFLLFGADLLHIPELPFLGVYALAVAFGFSERALISVLSAMANRTGLDIGKNLGQISLNEPEQPSGPADSRQIGSITDQALSSAQRSGGRPAKRTRKVQGTDRAAERRSPTTEK
jgi:hypothetical protein